MAHNQKILDQTDVFNETLNGFFEMSIDYATRIDPSYRQLWESMYGLIRSGGKRLRPKMLLLAYAAFGGTDTTAVIPVAVAQELLHFCLLIHDDIIDRDYTRYGTHNVAGRYKIAYSPYIDTPDDLTHYANGAALLGGDLMLSGAYQLVSASSLNEKEKNIALGFLSTSIFEVAGGELLDTELSFAPYNDGDALKVARYKTAGYSFVSPLLTGAMIAGADAHETKALNDFAQSLGIAFQLVDDILGVFGNENTIGKSTSSDITEGKRTYMVEQALKSMTQRERIVFDKAFNNPKASSAAIGNVRKLLESSGAKHATEQLAQKYANTARAALTQLSIDEDYRKEFESLISMVTERSF